MAKEDGAASERGALRRAARRERDLRPASFPTILAEEWHDRDRAFAVLRAWAQANAEATIDWYLRDKRARKRSSRALRALTIVFAAAGGLQPLLVTAGVGSLQWGYVLLGLAAACASFDHFFGLSSGWMRDMAAAQAVQQRLNVFQFAWAAYEAGLETRQEPHARGDDRADAAARLELLRSFAEDVDGIVRTETAEWATEFQSGLAQLNAGLGQGLPSRDSA